MAGRRFTSRIPRLTGRSWEEVARELEDFLKRSADAANSGVPSGFGMTGTTQVLAGLASSPGTEAKGWAAADHQHSVATAPAVALTPSSVNSEGTSSALARADHTHDVSALVSDGLLWAIIFGGE